MDDITTLVIDIWEGNPELNPDLLWEKGVRGVVIRINDIRGGLHRDKLFDKLWNQFSRFHRSIYFVFNPWNNWKINLDWLMANLPKDYKGRIFVDVEVEYDGITPHAYMNEIFVFIANLKNPSTIYTGQGSLDLLEDWPNCGYWWAQYLIPIQHEPFNISWEELATRISSVRKIPTNKEYCPGPVEMVQISDHLILPGFNDMVDINLFFGNEDDLAKYFLDEAKTNNEEGEKLMADYNNAAIGVHLTDAMNVGPEAIEGMKGHVDFLVGDGGYEDKWSTRFKEWAILAKTLNVPIIMKYMITGDGGRTYDLGKEDLKGFPDPAGDLQLLAERHAISGQLIHAIIQDFTDNTVDNGATKTAVVPEGNLRNLIQWFYENCFKVLKKPVYTFLSQEILDNSYHGETVGLSTYTSYDPSTKKGTDIGMCSWKTAFKGAITSMASWSNIPRPGPLYVPQYILNCAILHFINYTHTAFTFPGITNIADGRPIPVGLWIYRFNKATLYQDLNFTPLDVTPVTPPPTIDEPPVVTDPPVVTPPPSDEELPVVLSEFDKELYEDIKTILSTVQSILEMLKSIFIWRK